jgi:hypothetical protein
MLKTINQETTGATVNCLVIGQPGIGKTSLLRTIPPEEGVCTLSAESGLLSVRDMVQAGKIVGYEIESFADFEEVYNNLANNQQFKEAYNWVFIDSLTEIANRCVEKFKAKFPDKKDSFNLWGEYQDAMTRLIKGFRSLEDYNVVFTALEAVEFDIEKKRYIAPDMPGVKLKSRLPGYFDEVFYMTTIVNEKGELQRVFYTAPYNGYPGKDRSGKLEFIEHPNLSYIKGKIFG